MIEVPNHFAMSYADKNATNTAISMQKATPIRRILTDAEGATQGGKAVQVYEAKYRRVHFQGRVRKGRKKDWDVGTRAINEDGEFEGISGT